MIGKGKTTSSRLRHRVTLQQEVTTDDTQGGYTRSWEDVAELWAEISPINPGSASVSASSSEQYKFGGIETVHTYRIFLRYRSNVDASMRIVFGSRIFNIRSVINNDERNELLEIIAEEGVAA